MSRAARLQVADTGTDPAGAHDEHATAAALDRVVQLFSRRAAAPTESVASAPAETDLAASIDLVRRVAAQIRRLQEQARTVVQDSQQRVRAAGQSAAEAQATARSAMADAEQANRQVRELSARLVAAEARAAEAEARAAEAQNWLRRLHDCMANEFVALTIAPG